MATVTELRHRLGSVFSTDQAEALADVLHEVQETQVTRVDFHELKSVVQDLAEAQARTEQRVEELAGAQQELAAAQARTEQRVEELAEAQARTEQRVEELARAQTRTETALTRLARQVGGLSEAVGASLEDLACDIVPELLEKHWGMAVESAGPEELRTNGQEHPFDLVVRGQVAGRPLVALGEVKSNLSAGEAERFLKLVEKVRPAFGDAEVRVVFFGFRAERAAREFIRERGAAMVFSRGVMI